MEKLNPPFRIEKLDSYLRVNKLFPVRIKGRKRDSVDVRAYAFLLYNIWFRMTPTTIARHLEGNLERSTIRHHLVQALGLLADKVFLENTKEIRTIFPLPDNPERFVNDYSKVRSMRITVNLKRDELEVLDRLREELGIKKYSSVIKYLIRKKKR